MDERARNGDLHPLALRKTLRAAIGDGGEPQGPDELVDPRVERTSGETVQRAVIPDVLPGGEARVESARVRQHADGAPNGVAVADDIVRVDAGAAAVRDHERREHPQERGLARAIRSQEAGDSTIGRGERHTVDGAHFAAAAERLGQILDDDQVRAPSRSGQSGGLGLFSKCSTQDAGSVANVGSSMKAAMIRGAHACGDTMWP